MPKLTGIIGDRGDGKTLLMTLLLYQDYLKGRQIITNYSLYFPYVKGTKKPLKLPYNEIIDLPPILKECSLGLDELQMLVDSRRGLSKGTLQFTKFVTQMRKRGVEGYYTTQRYNMIDKRVREQTDVFIWPERWPCKLDNKELGQLQFRYTVKDAQYLDDLIEGTDKEGFRYYMTTKKLLSLYDTNEIIDYNENNDEDDD